MEKEDNIIVPRWFLEVVENTLRIQNNINLDKKTGETCQDRNVRESLNGVRKLLKGEELTGMERLEKLQPSFPSNLDEAVKKYANTHYGEFFEVEYEFGEPIEVIVDDKSFVRDAFKADAKWMAEQGETFVSMIDFDDNGFYLDSFEQQNEVLRKLNIKVMDRAIVQIRKK